MAGREVQDKFALAVIGSSYLLPTMPTTTMRKTLLNQNKTFGRLCVLYRVKKNGKKRKWKRQDKERRCVEQNLKKKERETQKKRNVGREDTTSNKQQNEKAGKRLLYHSSSRPLLSLHRLSLLLLHDHHASSLPLPLFEFWNQTPELFLFRVRVQ